ncbi:uncharacterized protein LOC141647197 [Silene latifolia]|uniref:uncharacterized protein LOC141647197 n=1 Tax=Silene latifolia TaxID=37657 RepID=UPI003D7702DC
MATSSTPSTTSLGKDSWLRSVMDKCILKDDGSNFLEWESNIKSAALSDNVLTYLTDAPPIEPGARASSAVRTAYDDYVRMLNDIKNVLIWSISPKLKPSCISLNAYEIFTRMITMFSQTPKVRQYDAAARFFEAKLERGQKVGPHVLQMVEYVDILERLGCKIPKTLVVDRILHSLPTKFAHFRVHYNMNGMDKSYHEIHALLTQAERDMEASGSEKGDVLTMKLKNMSLGVKKGKGKQKSQFKKSSKKIDKGKGKAVVNDNPKAKSVKLSEAECFHCNGKGHYRRSCPKYLEDLKEGRVTPIGMISSLYVIDVNYACTSTWVLDTGCGSHLCNHLRDLGASINVMPYARYETLGFPPLNKTDVVIQLADRSSIYPRGMVEDVLVEVDHLTFPADFYVLHMEADSRATPILLGRPFMKTSKTKIDVSNGNLTMEFDGKKLTYNIYDAMKQPSDSHLCYFLDIFEPIVSQVYNLCQRDPLEVALTNDLEQEGLRIVLSNDV